MMRVQRHRILAFGICALLALIAVAWMVSRSGTPDPSLSQYGTRDPRVSEEQRLHALALRDLKETQDEVAKMKAFGIGMPETAKQRPQR